MKGSKRRGKRPGTWELRVEGGCDPLSGAGNDASARSTSPTSGNNRRLLVLDDFMCDAFFTGGPPFSTWMV